ncbi:MAG: SDR family NAD(P)-dependent oxidoreductase [Gammaproteobacteria bacterium]
MSAGTRGLVWLVGASSGIGRALALRLAAGGWQVAISARSRTGLEKLAAEAPEGRLHAYPLDVTDAAQARATVQQIENDLGGIDTALLNAGDYEPMALEDFDAALFRRLIEVNYLGAVHCLEALLPAMRARARGQVLVTASLAGYRGLPRSAPYGASKAALINLAESLQPEMARAGIALRVINPGFVDTPLTRKNAFSMPFLMTPEQAAGRIYRGLERGGFEISFPRLFAWQFKLLRCLPYRLYFYLIRRATRT